MSLGSLPKRFDSCLLLGVSCLLAWLAPLSAWADAPPLGYVGPAPVLTPAVTFPPLGYVGPAPILTSTIKPPPLGYIGPAPHSSILSAAGPTPIPPPLYTHTGETLISAKQMYTDSDSGITTATGKVEIVRGDYVLHADKVTYNQKTGVMTADGHVAMLTPTGEVEFAKHEEVTGDMKQAFAENAGILFTDNSRMASISMQRFDERYTVADKGSYTACNVCAKNPDNPPLWQLHADSITHDNVDHELFYHNVTIDAMGIPVAYTPYLSGPDPTVKRLQGFLSPQPGYTPNLGAYIKTPYYFDIAPEKDATLTPTFSTEDKVQLAGQYRERFDQGNLLLNGSFARADLIDTSGLDKGEKWRGDLFGNFMYDIDNTWRVGSDVQYVSDSSYLNRYQISSLDQTTSRAFVEGFQGRDYVVVNTYHFQDLRPDANSVEPIVLPSATVSMLGDPGQTFGGRWSFDGNTLITQRDNSNQPIADQGPDTRRLSLNGGWERQLISDTGLITTVSGLVRTDSYWANNVVEDNGAGGVYSQAMYTRPFEQANAVMRYPMGRSGENYQQIMEPIVAVTAAPTLRTISEQPIEDSANAQFDETNLFSPNRFSGSDLIESGSRVTYGIRNAVTADNGARIDVFGGQSYDFSPDNFFPEESGLNTHSSDYVGRIDFAPAPWFNANYGFRLSENDFSPQAQDISTDFGVPLFRPNIRYIEAYQIDSATNLIDHVRQVTVGFNSKFEKYWNLGGAHTQAFDPQPGPRNTSLSLTYVDECFAYGTTLSRDDTTRADISSGTSITFHIYLKNLGGTGTDSVAGIQFPAEFRQTEE